MLDLEQQDQRLLFDYLKSSTTDVRISNLKKVNQIEGLNNQFLTTEV